jgi:hypothetical protein
MFHLCSRRIVGEWMPSIGKELIGLLEALMRNDAFSPVAVT